MSELVERLRRRPQSHSCNPIDAELLDEAASAIEALEARVRWADDNSERVASGLNAALERAERERDEAREALKPFAERGRAEFTTGLYHNPEPSPDNQIFGSELFLTIGDLRRAARVLSQKQG